MASTFTPNINLEEPARGDQVGVWDAPENANWTLTDLVVGGLATISLNNANVVLNAAQFQCSQITFNSTLTGSVTITFASSFKKPYTILNQCSGSSAFVITLATTAAGGQAICCPPGQPFDVINDGTNLKFKNFGPHIGGYWDYAGSSVPAWVSGCSVPPYLNCDGTAFSSATYPTLTVIMGGTTLPDSKGRTRAALNQGTGRLSSAVAGFNGDTLLAGGGSQSMQAHTHGITDPGHFHTAQNAFANNGQPGAGVSVFTGGSANTSTEFTNITVNSAGAGGSQNVQPTYVGGLTFIRAA